jgi:hypothetical protein
VHQHQHQRASAPDGIRTSGTSTHQSPGIRHQASGISSQQAAGRTQDGGLVRVDSTALCVVCLPVAAAHCGCVVGYWFYDLLFIVYCLLFIELRIANVPNVNWMSKWDMGLELGCCSKRKPAASPPSPHAARCARAVLALAGLQPQKKIKKMYYCLPLPPAPSVPRQQTANAQFGTVAAFHVCICRLCYAQPVVRIQIGSKSESCSTCSLQLSISISHLRVQ